jgi:NADH:ubiquinone oxidoreductase subunit K
VAIIINIYRRTGSVEVSETEIMKH